MKCKGVTLACRDPGKVHDLDLQVLSWDPRVETWIGKKAATGHRGSFESQEKHHVPVQGEKESTDKRQVRSQGDVGRISAKPGQEASHHHHRSQYRRLLVAVGVLQAGQQELWYLQAQR